jgi:(R,R)-butanediol dehydrogenase/meso-butanediol dehydrogenase/diacetyl reductase
MKAVRYYGKGDIRVEEVAAPSAPEPKQIVVKPKVCGICGTDLHEYAAGPIVTPIHKHLFTGATLPQILGHEFSAEVIEVGKDVTRIRKGERVSIQPLVMPLDDYYSLRGLNHLSPRMGCIGLSWAWGGMGEYAIVNDYNANKLPDSVNDEQGALIEPAAVALYGVERAKVGGGSTVLIAGAGPIGALPRSLQPWVPRRSSSASPIRTGAQIEALGYHAGGRSEVRQCGGDAARGNRGRRRGRLRHRMLGQRGWSQHLLRGGA